VLRAACVRSTNSEQSADELICTCGANGIAYVWSHSAADGGKSVSRRELLLRHDSLDGRPNSEPAQIYTCETLSAQEGLFLTAADDVLRLWGVGGSSSGADNGVSQLQPLQSLQFTAYSGGADTTGSGIGSSTFGGVRNPDDLCYIFDAKVAPGSTDVVGVACSDGTTRLVDFRASRAAGSGRGGAGAAIGQVCRQMLPINQFLGIDTTQENVRGLYPTSVGR
jgi:hypothetical protein